MELKIWKTEWQNIKQLREDGLSFQRIADMYGVTRQCIHQGLKKYNNKKSKK